MTDQQGLAYGIAGADWADEIAYDLWMTHRLSSDTGDRVKERTATALRKAKADGMRRVAEIVSAAYWSNQSREYTLIQIRAEADKLGRPPLPTQTDKVKSE